MRRRLLSDTAHSFEEAEEQRLKAEEQKESRLWSYIACGFAVLVAVVSVLLVLTSENPNESLHCIDRRQLTGIHVKANAD